MKNQWPDGVSDGLNLPCFSCGCNPYIDFTVDDEIWTQVINKNNRLNVCCLDCFYKYAKEKNINICNHIKKIQLIQNGHTVVFSVMKSIKHSDYRHS